MAKNLIFSGMALYYGTAASTRFEVVRLNNAEWWGMVSRKTLDVGPSEIVSDVIVMVGTAELTANLATVFASYSKWFIQCLLN